MYMPIGCQYFLDSNNDFVMFTYGHTADSTRYDYIFFNNDRATSTKIAGACCCDTPIGMTTEEWSDLWWNNRDSTKPHYIPGTNTWLTPIQPLTSLKNEIEANVRRRLQGGGTTPATPNNYNNDIQRDWVFIDTNSPQWNSMLAELRSEGISFYEVAQQMTYKSDGTGNIKYFIDGVAITPMYFTWRINGDQLTLTTDGTTEVYTINSIERSSIEMRTTDSNGFWWEYRSRPAPNAGTKTKINLRTKPSTNADIVTTVPKDKTVFQQSENYIYADEYEWVYVFYDGNFGWVALEYLTPFGVG
jgi:hypothetical protein